MYVVWASLENTAYRYIRTDLAAIAKFEQRYHNRPVETFGEPVHRKLTMISDSQGVANITWLAGSLYTIHRQEGEVLNQIVYHFSIELSGKLSDILATRRHGPSGGVDESDELGTNNATTLWVEQISLF